jgi:hypothetical protein
VPNGVRRGMAEDESAEREALHTGLKRVAVALKESGVPFALAGGYAAWVHGAPEPEHDVDFLIRKSDAETAREHLQARGIEVLEPVEDWLFKARVDEVVVDLLFRGQGLDPDGMLKSAETISVLSVRMPVLAATDVTVEKLLALDEHYCDLATVLPTLRALREQVDWADLRSRVAGYPFAEAVVFLADRLEIAAS